MRTRGSTYHTSKQNEKVPLCGLVVLHFANIAFSYLQSDLYKIKPLTSILGLFYDLQETVICRQTSDQKNNFILVGELMSR